jgi:hypothetical protein
MQIFAIVAFAAALIGVNANAATPQELAAFMEGAAATAPDDAENNFREVRRVISAPDGAPQSGAWVYLQLNTGAERTLYRQRVFHYTQGDDAAIIQHNYSFSEPAGFVDALSEPARLDALSMDELTMALEPGCEVVWWLDEENMELPWRGYVSPQDCSIFSSRRGSRIGIEGETRMGTEIIHQTERGYGEDGSVLFGTAPGEFITMIRE